MRGFRPLNELCLRPWHIRNSRAGRPSVALERSGRNRRPLLEQFRVSRSLSYGNAKGNVWNRIFVDLDCIWRPRFWKGEFLISGSLIKNCELNQQTQIFVISCSCKLAIDLQQNAAIRSSAIRYILARIRKIFKIEFFTLRKF